MSSQDITGIKSEASAEEQAICVACGFCCDGTLFGTAGLKPGERGNLPSEIEKTAFRKEDKEYFTLPCRYFSGMCTIYDQSKAYVCSAYRCQLLKDFEEGTISFHDALVILNDAIDMRNDIMKEYSMISGKEDAIFFRQLLNDLGVIM